MNQSSPSIFGETCISPGAKFELISSNSSGLYPATTDFNDKKENFNFLAGYTGGKLINQSDCCYFDFFKLKILIF